MLGFTILSFAITIISELLIVWLFTKKSIGSLAGYIFIINLFTWPLANIANGYIGFYATEAIAVLIESILFMLLLKMGHSKALLVSFTANAVSVTIGYVLFSLSF